MEYVITTSKGELLRIAAMFVVIMMQFSVIMAYHANGAAEAVAWICGIGIIVPFGTIFVVMLTKTVPFTTLRLVKVIRFRRRPVAS